MNKLKHFLPSSALITLYSSLILAYLNYGVLVWGNTQQTLLDKLLLLQKRALRIIVFNLHARAHTDTLFFDNKIFFFNKNLYCFQLGQFMYNYNSKGLPKIFNDLFHRNIHIHNYPTRRSGELHLPLLRTIHAHNPLIFTGPRIWNNLDHNIKGAKRLISFKYRLRKNFLEPYNTQ